MAIELYTHQLKVLEKIHNGSIIRGGVGTGKSIVALVYFFTKVAKGGLRINGKGEHRDFEDPKDIYVITTAKKRDDLDWEGEAVKFGISTERDLSVGGIQLTVDSWNNIMNYTEVKNAFFIFDEQRLVGAGAWVKAFIKIAKINEWIMLSATPGDNWMDYIPVFVANGFYKNRTEFVREHVIWVPYVKFPKVKGYHGRAKLNNLRRKILVEMPFEMHTKRHIKNVIVEYNRTLFDEAVKKRWNPYTDAPMQNSGELFQVIRRIVNSDTSRYGAVMELTEKHPKLIIFYNFNYELEILRTLGNVLDISLSEWNGHKHQPTPDTDRWMYLVQYTAGAEGWNCIETDAMIFYSLNYSYKVNEQAKGRIDRLNTPYTDLYYYIIRSISPIDQAIMKAITTKTNFNERDYIRDKWIEPLGLQGAK